MFPAGFDVYRLCSLARRHSQHFHITSSWIQIVLFVGSWQKILLNAECKTKNNLEMSIIFCSVQPAAFLRLLEKWKKKQKKTECGLIQLRSSYIKCLCNCALHIEWCVVELSYTVHFMTFSTVRDSWSGMECNWDLKTGKKIYNK